MRPPTGLTYYCFAFILLNLFVAGAFYLLIDSKKVTPAEWDGLRGDPEKQQNLERHAFLVAAHNSADRIKPCLDAILKLVKPHQIYIMDNGSSKVEEAKIRDFCKMSSDLYCLENGLIPGSSEINVAHLSNYGSKAIAQYACVYHLSKKLEDGTGMVDIVTLIDDDVCVSPEWNYKEVDRLLEDSSTVAVAYGIRASNADLNVCTGFQDLEYICGNVARYIQDCLGSQLFASGAIATWKVPVVLELLKRHPTHFNGEDLEFGVILGRLSDEKTHKLGINGVVKMAFYADCVIGTDVPPHIFHFGDFLPRPLYRYLKIKACECGEHSLFNQRFR
jgi:cellulose synthase/poly-beta-1,6-N-acetylglucosamine synthase-like glycosyltransferase